MKEKMINIALKPHYCKTDVSVPLTDGYMTSAELETTKLSNYNELNK